MKKLYFALTILTLFLMVGCSKTGKVENHYEFNVLNVEDSNYFEVNWTDLNKKPIIVIENNKGVEQEIAHINYDAGNLKITFKAEKEGKYKLKLYGDSLGYVKIDDKTKKAIEAKSKSEEAIKSVTDNALKSTTGGLTSFVGGGGWNTEINSEIHDVKIIEVSDLKEKSGYQSYTLKVDDISKNYVILFEADSYYVKSMDLWFKGASFKNETTNLDHKEYRKNVFSNYKSEENIDLYKIHIFGGFREIGDYNINFLTNGANNKIIVKEFWYK